MSSQEHIIETAGRNSTAPPDSKDFANATETTKDYYILEKREDNALDGSEWEIVDINDDSSDLSGTSFHFDMALGWGQWKHTLCSVDYKSKVHLAEQEEAESEKEDEGGSKSDSDDYSDGARK